ncbi:MAG: phage major capsid protein [Chloroflexota bacterium]|nr:phage major capsid protein [Chloroflexota bacterium]
MTDYLADLERIVSVADGRPLTEPQKRDFNSALEGFMQTHVKSNISGAYAVLGAIEEHGLEKPAETVRALKSYLGDIQKQTLRERLDEYLAVSGYGDGSNSPSRSGLPSHPAISERRGNKSWGEAVVDANSEYGAMKALLSAGTVPVSVPLNPDPVRNPVRPRFLREIIPSRRNDTGHFSYLRQTARTNNAAPVAEGGLKPTSVYTLERVDEPIATIAHLSEPIPRQQLEDAPLLRQFVDDELRLGLFLALDNQILNGNGTAPNLRGLNATTGVQTVTTGADALVRIRSAITALQQQDLEPDTLVVSPGDWAKIESVALAQFAANPSLTPLDAMTRRLFGVTVLVTNATANGTAWLGAFRDGSYLEMRQEARIDWSEAGYNTGPPITSDFERNLIRFRAEMRVGLAVTRPPAFVRITIA